MSKRKASAQNRFKARLDAVDENLVVANWGVFADERYASARELVEEWNASVSWKALAEQWPIKARKLARKQERLSELTVDFVRNAILKKDAEGFRKLADVLEQYHLVASPHGLILLTHVKSALIFDPAHRFTFSELIGAVAEFEGWKPPYEENFEKGLRRLIKKLGIPLSKGQ